MREEYEAWFIGKFGFPPMPIHSRVLDFCWEGYQAGREQGHTAIEIRMNDIKQERDQLRQKLTAAQEREQTNDTLLEQQGDKLAALNDLVAELRQQITLLWGALTQARHMIYHDEPQIGWSITRIDEVLASTKEQ